MKVEKVETIRVRLNDGYYVDVTPNDEQAGYFDFWLHKTGYGICEFMFGCKAKNEAEILDLIEGNVEDYIPDFEEA